MLKKPDPIVRIPGYREGEMGPRTLEETRNAIRALLEPVRAEGLVVDLKSYERRDGRSLIRIILLSETEVWYQMVGNSTTIREPLEAILGYTDVQK